MELPLLYQGQTVGELRMSAREGETCFEVTVSRPLQGIYRIIAQGEKSELLLGVLNGEQVLRRCFSAAITGKAGKICAVHAEKSGAAPLREWRTVNAGEFPMLPQLPRAALCRRVGTRHCLALPWSEDEPFPLVELFCFARIRVMNGRSWAVFAFDEGGAPVMEEEK